MDVTTFFYSDFLYKWSNSREIASAGSASAESFEAQRSAFVIARANSLEMASAKNAPESQSVSFCFSSTSYLSRTIHLFFLGCCYTFEMSGAFCRYCAATLVLECIDCGRATAAATLHSQSICTTTGVPQRPKTLYSSRSITTASFRELDVWLRCKSTQKVALPAN